jgi:acyl carrier protein phosphodiesterase
MNYLAHLYLSPQDGLSLTGNLMGDFLKGVDRSALPEEIQIGIRNHIFVDKFTDAHPSVRALKNFVSPQRRRYAPLIIDISFDYYLIKHWQQFCKQDYQHFVALTYQALACHYSHMPSRMEEVVRKMIKGNWLSHYQQLDGIATAIDSVSRRMRFVNNLSGGIEEVENNYAQFELAFLELMPDLIKALARR